MNELADLGCDTTTSLTEQFGRAVSEEVERRTNEVQKAKLRTQ